MSGELLAEEPALGADRHDHGVLDHLRLDQAEHLGAEVVATVGPAQPTARDRAEAQVHALDPRRVDEDLEARPRRRQVGDRRRLHLEAHVGVQRAVGPGLEVVGAQGRLDVGQVGPQDPVVVEAGHVVEGPLDAFLDLLDPRGARLGVGVEAALARVEASLEQLPQQPGDVGVAPQRGLDVVDRERRVALLHVLRVGAEHGRLPPGQSSGQHQGVEAVDLVVALPHRPDRVLEQAALLVREAGRVLQAELVDHRRPVEAVELVGPFVEHLDAHRREHRQHLRERERRAHAEHLQPRFAAARVERREEREVDPRVARRWPRDDRRRARPSWPRSPPCRPRGTSRRSGARAASRGPRRTR